MRGKAEMTAPEIALVLGTRAALGIGLGFLLSDLFARGQRRTIGWTLLLGGAFAATALGFEAFGRPRQLSVEWGPQRRGGESATGVDYRLLREALRAGD